MQTKNISKGLAAISLIFSSSLIAHGGGHPIRYIAENGVDKGECAKPTSPCKTIAYAVNKSNKGDTIRMASGTYYVKDMDLFYLLNDMVAISGGYALEDRFRKQASKNITTIIGLPAEYRDKLAAKGFKLISDTKGNDEHRIKPEYLKLLARYNKINSSFESKVDCTNGTAGRVRLQQNKPTISLTFNPNEF